MHLQPWQGRGKKRQRDEEVLELRFKWDLKVSPKDNLTDLRIRSQKATLHIITFPGA